MLLIMGTGASMLWWQDDFCLKLAAGGRFVIRYDHRDTGRFVTYEPGHPGYDSGDLVEDAVGVLDAFEIRAAHLVGVSAGGALAQLVALDHPDRTSTLTLISTTFAVPTARGRDLPGPTREFVRSRVSGCRRWWYTVPRTRCSHSPTDTHWPRRSQARDYWSCRTPVTALNTLTGLCSLQRSASTPPVSPPPPAPTR